MASANPIIGGYRLMRHLWQGQESQVWEVAEPASGRHFAMKILLPEKVHDEDARGHLFNEAQMGKYLAHPNLIKIITVSKDKNNPHFVMEFFPSGSLKSRIQRYDKEKEFIREHGHNILKSAATALAFMNAKGYVHRDVKPDNILVNPVGETKLIDFALAQKIPTGLARLFHRRESTVAGTRSYMSPEQIRSEALDGRADIYCFAASAYEMVTGRPPFRGASNQDLLNKHLFEKPISPCSYNDDVTREFGDYVLRLLAKKREDRPANFHEVLMELRTLRIFKSTGFKRKGPREE